LLLLPPGDGTVRKQLASQQQCIIQQWQAVAEMKRPGFGWQAMFVVSWGKDVHPLFWQRVLQMAHRFVTDFEHHRSLRRWWPHNAVLLCEDNEHCLTMISNAAPLLSKVLNTHPLGIESVASVVISEVTT
jgi:hypothetical protein